MDYYDSVIDEVPFLYKVVALTPFRHTPGVSFDLVPRGIFHRIVSGEEGSASLNFAVHYAGIDMRTNFNIYSLQQETGEFAVLREGYLDQTDYTEVRPVVS